MAKAFTGLRFNPRPGTLLMCDFDLHADPRTPEMTKCRPVVVLAQRGRRLCNVVSLSTVAPAPVKPWHHLCRLNDAPTNLKSKPTWAKCDMVHTVAYWRLDRCYERRSGGQRIYNDYRLSPADLDAVLRAVAKAFGLPLDGAA